MTPTLKIAAFAFISSAAACAQAGTLTAGFTYDHPVTVRINTGPVTGDVRTVDFRWTRTDTPGPGVDSTVAREFRSFCFELDQTIRSSRSYTFNVRSLAEAGFSLDTELAVQSLWSARINETNTATGNAAFQLALWELRYDADRRLDTGLFTVGGSSAAITLAQSWLNGLSDTTTVRDLPTLRLLDHPDAQNQIVEIPEPGAIACMLAGLGLLRRRRIR
ncbi:MAG: hypothetical protein ACK4WH_05600 [Phycisphaerales bacterium]